MEADLTYTYVFTYFMVTVASMAISGMILRQLTPDMGSEQEIRAFRGFVLGFFVFAISNAFWIWINYGYLPMRGEPFSMINLIAICVASYYWYIYVQVKLSPARIEQKWYRVTGMIPLTVAIILVVTTPFTKWVFYYTPDNQYVHGPAYITMLVLATVYLIMAFVNTLRRVMEIRTPRKRREYKNLLAFLFFPVGAGVIDVFVPNLPVMELALLFGLILIYTNMQQSQIYYDALTGLNNRRLADQYLADKIAAVSEDDPFYFFIADADGFKSINDTYGHAEGDNALRLISEAFKELASDKHCFVSRFGGDEFLMIIDCALIASPEELIDALNDRIAVKEEVKKPPYRLGVSVGYTDCVSPKDTPEDILARADRMMYEKKQLKGVGRRRRGA